MSLTKKVQLTNSGGTDILKFLLFEGESEEEQPYIDLNSSDNQTQIKDLFVELLKLLKDNDIKLELAIDNDYDKELYIDVCKEYINELNKELVDVRQNILNEIQIDDNVVQNEVDNEGAVEDNDES